VFLKADLCLKQHREPVLFQRVLQLQGERHSILSVLAQARVEEFGAISTELPRALHGQMRISQQTFARRLLAAGHGDTHTGAQGQAPRTTNGRFKC
jgi:hypothetical protein